MELSDALAVGFCWLSESWEVLGRWSVYHLSVAEGVLVGPLSGLSEVSLRALGPCPLVSPPLLELC